MAEINVGSYVELKDGFDEIYRLTQVGQRAWVRDRRVDEYEFAEVFIEWDKDDWRYSGESDGWTFESHFQLASADAPESNDEHNESDPCPHCGHDHNESANEVYLEALKEGTDEALASDGFVIITIREEKDLKQGVSFFTPKIYKGFLTPEASAMIEAQMLYMASCVYQEETVKRLDELKRNSE